MNNLPSTVGGGGFHADGKLPRFREDDFRAACRSWARSRAPTLVDWPVDYDEMEPYYAEAERVVGVAGDHGANPFASWRADPYPMPPGPDMYCAVVTTEAATRLGYHPYRAPTGRQQRRVRRPARVQQLRVLRLLRLPDRGQGRPGRAAAPRAAHRPLRDPPESYVTDIVLDGTGRRARGVRYLDADARRARGTPDGTWSSPAARSRRRACCCAPGSANPDLVGHYLMYHFQTFMLGMFPFRLHGHRGRSVTHLMDDPIVPDDAGAGRGTRGRPPLLPRRDRRARRGRAPGAWRPSTSRPARGTRAADAASRRSRDRMAVFTMQGEDLPSASNRIDLDPQVSDV